MDSMRAILSIYFVLGCLTVCSSVSQNVTNEHDGLEYLLDFGYMTPGDPRTGALTSKDAYTDAIRAFQGLAGLNVTGELDDETKKTMSLPRCGVKDIIGTGDAARRRKRYALQGSKWAKRDLTYRIQEYATRLGRADIDDQVARAFKVWSDVTSLTFTKRTGPADIDILWAKRHHGDRNAFDGEGRTLAHAFFPRFGGDAHFDDDERWTVRKRTGVNLFQVAAHEFGHSLGLSHSSVRSSLMAPFYRGYQASFQLDPDDVAAIQELYGTRGNQRPVIPPRKRPRPTRGPIVSIPQVCKEASVDAITRTPRGLTYAFKGRYYYRLNKYGIDNGYPRLIEDDWGVAGPVDAALSWDRSYTFLFKGDEYWKFSGTRKVAGYPKKIRNGFIGVPNNIDAAFVWSGNGKTYFVKGNQYYRFSKNSVDYGYPKPFSIWKGVPTPVTAAFKWQNGRTYFFNGTTYYKFNDNQFSVETTANYPRQVANWWFGCPDRSQMNNYDDPSADISQTNGDSDGNSIIHGEDYVDEQWNVVDPDVKADDDVTASSRVNNGGHLFAKSILYYLAISLLLLVLSCR